MNLLNAAFRLLRIFVAYILIMYAVSLVNDSAVM